MLRTRRAAAYAPVVAASAAFAVMVTNLFDLRHDELGVRFLSADSNFSWSHDVDHALLAIMAVVAILASRHAQARRRRLWLTIATIFGALFLDEMTSLHAVIGDLSGGKLLYTPILVALAACMWRLVAATSQRYDFFVGVGFLCGSFFIHSIGMHFARSLGYETVAYQATVGVKEGCELGGLLVFLIVLLRLWNAERGRPARLTALFSGQSN